MSTLAVIHVALCNPSLLLSTTAMWIQQKEWAQFSHADSSVAILVSISIDFIFLVIIARTMLCVYSWNSRVNTIHIYNIHWCILIIWCVKVLHMYRCTCIIIGSHYIIAKSWSVHIWHNVFLHSLLWCCSHNHISTSI